MTTKNPLIPPTQNEAWGFYGTMHDDAPAAWPLALNAIVQATKESPESVRIFLDSRHGRHFADGVTDEMFRGCTLDRAIAKTVDEWMGWRTGSMITRDLGIPRGLPYLTAFVVHATITDLELNPEPA